MNNVEWNRVTWYSKLLAIVIFIGVIPTLTFYIGMKYQEAVDANDETNILTLISSTNSPLVSNRPSLPLVNATTSASISSSTTYTVTSSTSNNLVLTLKESGQTFHLKVGNSFLLKLGNDHQWSLNVSDQSVIDRVKNVMVINGAQGIYRALKPGRAMISATGSANCDANTTTSCPQSLIEFQATLIVST